MDLNERNTLAIQQAINTLHKENIELKENIQMLEQALAILQAEMNNQKQLTAHVLGRGMGSTVQED